MELQRVEELLKRCSGSGYAIEVGAGEPLAPRAGEAGSQQLKIETLLDCRDTAYTASDEDGPRP